MPFIKNIWYVAAWTTELPAEAVIGRTIIGEPVALYRRRDGSPVAVADRCAHRHAPLSLGRVEGDEIRCMYHGLKFDQRGQCVHVPGDSAPPPNSTIRTFPVVERYGWVWVWMGDPASADPGLIPVAWGLDNDDYTLRTGAIDYDAHYELINDNLCDLSHLDFTHETTLGAASGARWSESQPRIKILSDGVAFERWFTNRALRPDRPDRVDGLNSYRYHMPGIFVMTTDFYPLGTAQACGFETPEGAPIVRRVEQQAVTPIGAKRTRYHFGTGIDRDAPAEILERVFEVVNAAFAEDRAMIEGQQRIQDLTPPDLPKAFIPQDKGPSILRRLILRRLAEESRPAEKNPVQ